MSIDESIVSRSGADVSEEPLRLRSGPFWAELRIFLAVARSGSYSRATALLNCSQPTVGRAMKRLEDIIGTRLALPNAKGIFLTEAGQQLAYSLSKLDRELSDITTTIKRSEYNHRGTVIISCPEAICGFFIAPEISMFSSINPGISMTFLSKKSINSLKSNDYDVLVTTTKYHGSDFEITAGGYINFVPMASIDYLKAYGIPTANNLTSHRFVDSPVYDPAVSSAWLPWRRLLDDHHIAHTCENSFPYGLMIRSGLGIGLLANYAMNEPSLVPLDIGEVIRIQIRIVALKERLKEPHIAATYNWLCETLSDARPWLSANNNARLKPDSRLANTFSMLLPEHFGEYR